MKLTSLQNQDPAQPAEPSITLDFKMATDLLKMFGGEPGLVTLQHGGEHCHSGSGLYAWYSDRPEEGSEFLGAAMDGDSLSGIDAARASTECVQEDAARESEYRRGYRHGYEQRDAEVRGAMA